MKLTTCRVYTFGSANEPYHLAQLTMAMKYYMEVFERGVAIDMWKNNERTGRNKFIGEKAIKSEIARAEGLPAGGDPDVVFLFMATTAPEGEYIRWVSVHSRPPLSGIANGAEIMIPKSILEQMDFMNAMSVEDGGWEGVFELTKKQHTSLMLALGMTGDPESIQRARSIVARMNDGAERPRFMRQTLQYTHPHSLADAPLIPS